MSIFDTIFGRKKELSLQEGPTDNIISKGKARFASFAGTPFTDLTVDPTRTFRSMRELRNIYLQGAYIAEAVDLYPLYAIGNGYELEIDEDIGDGEQAKNDVEDFLTRINFYDTMWQLMVDAEVVRDGIAEIVYGRGSSADVPINVVVRPGECFKFDTDAAGVIQSYTQTNALNGDTLMGEGVKLEPSQVLHYQFLSRPDSPYGISIVERVKHDIKRDTQVIEAITNGMVLHGSPKWQIAVNKNRPDAPPLSDTDWDTFKKEFENITSKDNFPTEGDIDIIPKDIQGLPNVQQYSDVSMIRVISGMGCPAELLGLRQGTSDASARSRIGAFFKKIKSCQRDIEQLWNAQIIDKITGQPGLIKLKLQDTDPQDFNSKATGIAALRSGIDPDAVFPADWCREQFGVPADEELPAAEQEEKDPDQSGLRDWLGKQNPTTPPLSPKFAYQNTNPGKQ